MLGLRLQPAAHHRSRDGVGLRISVARPAGPVAGRACRDSGRADGRGQSEPTARTHLQHLFGELAAALPQSRPRSAASARGLCKRSFRNAAGHARILLRQRLQSFRPKLESHDAGGRSGSRCGRRHLPVACTQRRGRYGPRGLGRARGLHRRAAVDRALQQLPLDHTQRAAGARHLLGSGAGRYGTGLRRDSAAGLQLRVDGNGAAGARGRRPDDGDPGIGPALRLSLPRGALRKLDDPHTGSAFGVRRGGRCSRGGAGCRSLLRHLCPDRPRRLDRARLKERDPDRRIRKIPTGERRDHRRCRGRARGPVSAR